MRVYVETFLPCSADVAWAAVQTQRLLTEVCSPLAAIAPAPGESLPEGWLAGATIRCRMFLFGFLPLGVRTLFFQQVDQKRRQIQTHESDALIARWDHLVRIGSAGKDYCRYSDEIEIEAGLLTPIVWLFAKVFYRHRQRKWQRIAQRLQAAELAMS